MTSPTADHRGDLVVHTHDLGKRFGQRTALAGVDLASRAASRSGSSAPTARARPR